MKKVALITGGTRGIGLGIARCLAEQGFHLALNGLRDAESVEKVITELGRTGLKAIYCQGDVGQKDDRDRILSTVQDAFGRLNVLVNNAGVGPRERRDVLETTEDSFERVLRINLFGPYFLSQAAARWMIDQKSENPDFEACIVNVSSISATVASINRGEYCIAKAGLSMTTKLFAVRLGEFDIPVYEVRPGIVKTDMTAIVSEKYDALIEQGLTVQKRWGSPEDVGKAVAALVSGSFPYSTGAVVMVDGGLTVNRL